MLPKEDLNALRKALGIEYAVGGEPFSTNKFFEDFNGKIPKSATTSKDISPDEIATYRRDVEEPNKKYFVGWRDNGKCNKRVTKHNLHKTKRLLGEKAYRIADKANYSSCWSDNKAKAIECRLP